MLMTFNSFNNFNERFYYLIIYWSMLRGWIFQPRNFLLLQLHCVLLIIVISKRSGMLFNFWHKYAVYMDYIRIPEQGNYREITGKLWGNHPRPWWLKCKRFHLVNMGVLSMYDNMHFRTLKHWNVFFREPLKSACEKMAFSHKSRKQDLSEN